MKERIRLIDVFPDWLADGGIFAALDSLEVPWAELGIAADLDAEYFGNISGDKYISPLVEKTLTDGELLPATVTALAGLIYSLNIVNWAKEWATLSAVYDPIQNYSMTEEMTDDETVIEYGRTHTMSSDVYGFNSSDPSPSGGTSDGDEGSDTHTRNYTLTRSGNIGVTTSQQMLQSERDLWVWNFFFDVVFPSIDRVLTISIY